MNKKLIGFMSIMIIVLLVGCTTPKGPSTGTYEEITFDPDLKVTTKNFKSVEELNDFIKSNVGGGSYLGGVGLARAQFVEMEESVAVAAETTAGAPAPMVDKAGGESLEYSETNVQVAGVDEADIIKTDGDYIYTISNNKVFIVKAYPGEEAEVVATLDYEDNSPSSIFIKGDKLAVFGNFYDIDFFRKIDFTPRYGMTFFDIYDISDRSEPELEKKYKFEGNYMDARMKDEYIYFVVRNQPVYRPVYPTPLIVEGTVARAMPVSEIYYYDIPYRNPQFVTVHTINMETEENTDSKSVAVEYSQNLYMSGENIFITYTQTISEWELQQQIIKELLEEYVTDADKELIEKIKATDNEVLSKYEKDAKILQIYMSYLNYLSTDEQEELQDKAEELLEKKLEEYEHLEFTVINRISVDKGNIEVEDNGKVPGHIMNQFSLDEKDDVLRIATTISQRWSMYGKERTESTNNVYSLDSSMKIIGKLEGLAETEQIYSTRFIGDKLYMVTFRQVDPFFVIDLSDPEDIKELGKLKIPGFSRYLHPYDENTIIGIGQDTTEQGRTKGLKISLFDVSDFENPEEIAKYVTEERYAQSTALYEHKAFLFNREKELLVIPAYSYDYEDNDGYNGAFVFKITKDEIELRGLIDHSMASGSSRYYYAPQVERSLYIEELLYTKSPTLLRINELDDLSSVKNITLESRNPKIPVY